MKHITRRFFLQSASANAALLGLVPTITGHTHRAHAAESIAKSGEFSADRAAFSFLHTYESTGRYWRGLEKAGLLRATNGVRLINSPWGDDARRFNQVARRGGPLEQILQERRCPFIVDRVVGGSKYYPYAFDPELVKHYQGLLGDKFLGGQVHETISNVRGVDWGRLRQARKTLSTDNPTAEQLRQYFTGVDAPHWLDYGTPESYAGQSPPRDEAGWWREFARAAKTQGARFGARFSYCEGTHCGRLVWHAFYKFGAAYGIAEVGPWASQQTQFAIASLRGAARAAGRPWGVFFAPWGPKGCTCFVPPAEISWQVDVDTWAKMGYPIGPQYGCSSALQRRIFFHAYLAGAHTLHEEWGAEGNLLDWDAGTLSSYGRATREFLDFQDVHPDVGTPYTPIALVLDAAVPPPNEEPWKKLCAQLFRDSEADKANRDRNNSGVAEVACYPPCALPEMFDVVPSDAPAEVWRQYQEVIPVGTSPVPGGKASLPEEVYARLAAAVAKWSPLSRKTHLPMQINRRQADGAWIVALYNPWGAVRGAVDAAGSVLNEACAIQDVLRPTFTAKAVRTLYAWPQSSAAALQADGVHVTVGPGGTLVLEIAAGDAVQ